MATRFNFSMESDGLNNEQAATFAAFVKSLQVKSEIGPNLANADYPVPAYEINSEDIYALNDADKMETPTPAKKKRASRSISPEQIESEEIKKFLAEEKADRDAQEQADKEAYESRLRQSKEKDEIVAQQEAESAEILYKDIADQDVKKVSPPTGAGSPVTLDTLKKLVGEKQAKHRDEIKAYFLKKGGYKTTTLPDSLYEQFHDLLTAMD
jgi:hypothetical protein